MKKVKGAYLLTFFVIVLLALLLHVNLINTLYGVNGNQASDNNNLRESNFKKEGDLLEARRAGRLEEGEVLTEAVIIEKTDLFIETLVQEINEDYSVINYSSKEQLYELFDGIATRESVKPYLDFYYQELDDSIYILPTELPPWFVVGVPYEVTESANGTFVVFQETVTDLHGPYKIEIEFAYNDNWEIIRINHFNEEVYPGSTDII
ncbi:hypothetical protein SAMN04488134_111117 [Amphibacillus marinus]|uniref:Uncharacterized protein n=1 Tax=Amphibacillus marinus TaxID=872970 RepID=A0A1H8S111_9BACI|nr:hypothetical protein [Amphibacillus marinus]SEO72350.1 hypothetical protein SAMN04488134_111117 [Amphibacillus marinus]